MSRSALRFTKINISLAAAAVLVVTGGGLFWWNQSQESVAPKSPTTVHAATASPPKTIQYVTYHGVAGRTALELLKSHATVQTKTSSYGEFVTSINGNDGGGKKYWTFYVNGAEAQTGAGVYITTDSDTIEWKLQ